MSHNFLYYIIQKKDYLLLFGAHVNFVFTSNPGIHFVWCTKLFWMVYKRGKLLQALTRRNRSISLWLILYSKLKTFRTLTNFFFVCNMIKYVACFQGVNILQSQFIQINFENSMAGCLMHRHLVTWFGIKLSMHLVLLSIM